MTRMRGFTLLEALVALMVVGVLAALGLTGAAGLRDRLAVEGSASQVLEAYSRARMAALLSGNAALLDILPQRLTVFRVQRADTVPVWTGPGPALSGVTLTAGAGRIPFGANGLSYGVANRRFELRRGAIIRAVVASRPGRLRVERLPRRRRPDRRAPRYRGTS